MNPLPHNTSQKPAADLGETAMHFLDYWRVMILRWPLILLVFLLVVGTTGVWTVLTPRLYASRATIQIHLPGGSPGDQFNIFSPGVQRVPPTFILSQFEILKSREVLNEVIKNFNLQQVWEEPSLDSTFVRLSKMMNVSEVRNTDMINISVYSTDPEEAAMLANGIAEEYRATRAGMNKFFVDESFKALEAEVENLKQKMNALGEDRDRLRIELNIIDLYPDTIDQVTEGDNAVIMNLKARVNEETMRVSREKTIFDQITKMSDEQVASSPVIHGQVDPTINRINAQLQEVDLALERLVKSGIGEAHPQRQALEAQKRALRTQLTEQVASLRNALRENLDTAEAALVEYRKQLEEAENEQRNARIRNTPYYDKKAEYIRARQMYHSAHANLEMERIKRVAPEVLITMWEKATPSSMYARPRVVFNMVIACFAGLLFGGGLAFFIEYLDTSVKRMDEIEAILNVPLLAVIPQNISILIDDTDDNPDAEGYRIMRTNIEFNRKSPDANTLTIVSGGPGEGKSLTLNNLACIFARGGYTSLIIDADFRRPSQHRIFGVQNNTGLSDYLTHETPIEELVRPTKEMNLFLMTSGRLPSDAVGLLNSQRMLDLVDVVKSRFDMVFFDSPPILGVSDASVLSSAVDLTMIVVQHRRYPRSVLQRVKQSITNVGGNIIGVVLNNVDVRQDAEYGYYTSYYNYYYHKQTRDNKNRAVTDAAAKTASAQATDVQEIKNDEKY